MIQIDDESADLCTFGTPFGRYQYLRLPYGINSSSEVFHAKIRQFLEDLDGVDSFVDDVIVWGSTMAEHDERLSRLMNRAGEIGIKFNREKCEFRVEQVVYLGHKFSARGMEVDDNKVKAIKEMRNPTDRPSLERFIGMINYLSRFISRYSETIAPLRALLKRNSEWVWDSTHDAAVEQLKQCVCEAPVLALYSARAPVLLSVDASSRALGAVLMQEGRPVEFASLTLTDTQCRYAQIEKEMLAIVFALERFHQYVFGRSDVTVETDHKPLEALFKKSLDAVPTRLQRMMLRVQRYDFNVVYKPGKYMYVADTLSRAPLPELMRDNVSEEVTEQTCFLLENVRFTDNRLNSVRKATSTDLECQLILKYIQNGWPENKYETDSSVRKHWSYRETFEYADGIIFKDNLVYIPRELRAEMVTRVHDGHLGIDRCKRNAREVMFWPGMSVDVEQAVRRCSTCRERAARPQREPMIVHEVPSLPWHKVGSDLFEHNKRQYMILVDYFSNYVEVSPLSKIDTRTVVTAMKDQFARHGIPAQLVTDNGPAYASKEFREFSKSWGFVHITTSPNYPQANGRSEVTVKTIKHMIIKTAASQSDFCLGLLNYRTTPRDGISSPAQLMMGRRLNTRLPSHISKLEPERDNERDYHNIMKHRQRDKVRYDAHARPLPELNLGEPVVVVDGQRRRRMRVESRASQPRSYWVSDGSGKRYRRNRRHLIRVDDPETEPTSSQMNASPGEVVVSSDDGASDREQWCDVDSAAEEEQPAAATDTQDKPRRAPRQAAIEAKDKIFKRGKK